MKFQMPLCTLRPWLAIFLPIAQERNSQRTIRTHGELGDCAQMTQFTKFLRFPICEQGTLMEAIFCLGLARLLLLVPFRRLAPLMGQPQGGLDRSTVILRADERAAALAVRDALLRIAARLPWHSSCLVRALAGGFMVRRRRLPSVIHLGAQGGAERELSAHAWLRCGDVDVVGAEISDEYTPIVAFHA